MGVTPDDQVGPFPRRLHIDEHGRHAGQPDPVHRNGPDPGGARLVVVGAGGKTKGQAGVVKGDLQRAHSSRSTGRSGLDRWRRATERRGNQRRARDGGSREGGLPIANPSATRRSRAAPVAWRRRHWCPTIRRPPAPAVEEQAVVDGMNAVAPVVGPSHSSRQVAQFVGEIGGPMIGAGFEEQDPSIAVFGQPAGEGATGRSGAHDDGVEAAGHDGELVVGRRSFARTRG